MKIIRNQFKELKRILKDLVKEFGDEAFQVAVIHRILGGKGENIMTDNKMERKISLLETLSTIFHQFSDEDEVDWSQITNCIEGADEQKFFDFVDTFIQRGFDEDTFRVRLVKSWRKDEESTQETLLRIIALNGDYEAQERLAIRKKLLVKKNPIKKFVHLVLENKLTVFLWIIFGILLILATMKKLFS